MSIKLFSRDLNKEYLRAWSPVAVICTVVLLIVYLAVASTYRQNANDPQVELVENLSAALSTGIPASFLFNNVARVDMNTSLSLFAIAFDDTGKILATSGFNATSTPYIPPIGVFEYVRSHGQDRVTWEPVKSKRYALVMDNFKLASSSGFVMAARSLRETELRKAQLGSNMFVGWLLLMILNAVGVIVSKRSKPNLSSM